MSDSFTPELLESVALPTPYFAFSKEQIKNTYKEYVEAFPSAEIHYAMKANAEPELLKILLDAGASFEVASKYELEILKKINVHATRMIYGSSIKSGEAIKNFFDYGVERFAADSFTELEKIASNAPGAKVFVRLSVDDAGSVFKFSEKFGTEKENIVPLLERARDLGLHPYGISFHVGSQASNPSTWTNALKEINSLLVHLQEVGIQLEAINIGGGFPCQYASTEVPLTLAEISKSIHEEYKNLPYQPKILLEPGRGMVATTAVAVATVIARIDRREHTWLFLDLGVYNGLFETMAYQGSIRYRVSSMRPSYDAGEALFSLAGPTGDSPDVITREALLPQDINVGDKLIFHDVGAYSLVATCAFNGFPKPAVCFI